MLFLAHRAIVAAYVILPALAILAAAREARRTRRAAPLTSLSLTFVAGAAIGLAVALVYAVGTSGRLIAHQVLLAGYFATGLLLVLKGFDALLRAALSRLVGLRPDAGVPEQADPARPAHVVPPPSWGRAAFVGVARAAILFALGLPYVMAAALTYRPKVAPIDDPRTQLGFDFQRVEFEAIDGTPLVGWWIPAQRPLRRGERRPDDWGRRTVIVCHGLAANKSNQLVLARAFPPEGMNVLIFDFRAHGESAGQLTTFGDRERADVLGAVRWVRSQRAGAAEKLYGVGASMGAAALIAAAAHDSDDGRAIDAIAVYGTYDRLDALTRSVAHSYFFPPLRQLLIHVGLPLAGLQTGAPLSRFAPADLAAKLWPRPILVIHGRRDEIVDFGHGDALYESAAQPKYHFYLKDATHNAVVTDEAAAKLVAEFFKQAQPVPVI